MTVIYPVIHHDSHALTLEQAHIAYRHGADGVFLISHNGEDLVLPGLARRLKQEIPNFKLGINLLSTHIIEAVEIAREYGLDMIWGDYCGVNSEGLDKNGVFLSEWVHNNPLIAVFASVVFKYQKTDPNPPQAAVNAQAAGFIATTSGSGTGKAPNVEKIQSMSAATQGVLAVASGMTVENVSQFQPYLSHILVSTGVSQDDYRFDEDKLQHFIAQVKQAR